MPDERILVERRQYVAKLKESLKSACVGVIVSYKDIAVTEDTKLRKDLYEAGDTYRAIKSTLLSHALKGAGIEGLNQVLEGTTAIAYSNGSYIFGAEIPSAFADKSETSEIKAGFVDGNAVSTAAVKELTELPSKKVLVTKALGDLNTPITGFVTVLNRTMKDLVVALSAIAGKQAANT